VDNSINRISARDIVTKVRIIPMQSFTMRKSSRPKAAASIAGAGHNPNIIKKSP
jgi:hypothetical protein